MTSRREFLELCCCAASVFESAPVLSQEIDAPDYNLDIAPAVLDLSPRHQVRTVAYNGCAPGPLLRLREGRPVTVHVTNRSDRPEVVHWHGLSLPSTIDGAVEEGTRVIAPNSTARYTFTPRPAGFRWYHTHTMAMGDFTRGQYSGQHGMLMIESRDNPARYDQEFFLDLHDWEGHLFASDDGAMNPSYRISTINGKVMGFGEPLRVREGQLILLHLLNSSATETHWIALSGHSFRVVALDGNPVATPRELRMLRLAPAERVCVVVSMNNPGVWMLGEVRKHIQAAGMAVVLEYADRSGRPQWQQPSELRWSYGQFAASEDEAQTRKIESTIAIPLILKSEFRGHGAMEGWTINGKSYPYVYPTLLELGQRYRLQMINASQDDHPLHLHRHSFELSSLGVPLDAPREIAAGNDRGVVKDVVLVEAGTRTDVEFTADNPGATLFHCHQQNHMDLGFMMLFNYA
jgi:FtsP/CotA-like multicopper oxidase with cupredoxin domain